jgi:hypothetical protein
MTIHLGFVIPGSVIYVPFHTFNSSGASVTIAGFALADIKVFKDGSTTERTSTAGYALLDTDGIDFDGITGVHGLSINLADNTDAGFYAAGSTYWIVVSSVTIDGQVVNFVAATFFIGPAAVNVTQWSGTAIPGVDTAGYPVVTVKDGTGQGEILTTSGAVDLVTTTTNLTNAGGLTQADVRTAVGLASANLDTQLGAIAGFVDTEIGALTTAVAALPTADENADALLVRDWTAVVGVVPSRSTLNALRFLRNRWTRTATLLTVYAEDDTATAWTSVLTASASLEPVASSDPP